MLEIFEGDEVTLEAVSNGNHNFLGWFNNGEQKPFSTEDYFICHDPITFHHSKVGAGWWFRINFTDYLC